jgi:hypothetical protein
VRKQGLNFFDFCLSEGGAVCRNSRSGRQISNEQQSGNSGDVA